MYSECVDDVNGVSARDQLRKRPDAVELLSRVPGKRAQVKRKWVRREASLSKASKQKVLRMEVKDYKKNPEDCKEQQKGGKRYRGMICREGGRGGKREGKCRERRGPRVRPGSERQTRQKERPEQRLESADK